MADYLEGAAMSHTDSQLRKLHSFAEDERVRQAAEIENERLHQVAEVERKNQEHQEKIQFISSFLEKIRQIHDIGHNSCVQLPDGYFLKILVGPQNVEIAMVPESSTPIYTINNQLDEKLEFLVGYRNVGVKEDLYVWDKSSLVEQSQEQLKSVYSFANIHLSDIGSAKSLDSLSDTKIQQLRSLLPFKLEDLDQFLSADK